MTAQILVGVAGIVVALFSFLLGTFRAKAATDGAMASDVASSKVDIACLKSNSERNGNRLTALEQGLAAHENLASGIDGMGKSIARLEALFEALGERLEDRYDATRALYARLDDIRSEVTEIHTLCNERNRVSHSCKENC